MTKDSSPRAGTEAATSRKPRQARSIARRALILRAAERVLVEQGYQAVTTTSVARQAGVPVGSVYQYFVDRQALLDELAAGYLADFDEVLLGLESDERLGSDPVRLIFDRYVALIRNRPGFRALWLDRRLSEVGVAADRASTTRIAAGLAMLAARHRGREPSDLDRLRTEVAVEAADALLQQAFRRDPDGDEPFLDQAKLLLHLYMTADTGTES